MISQKITLPSRYDNICTAFSESRMTAYLIRTEYEQLDALAAYYWNLQLSQAFYPILHALEVTLRNTLHRSLSENYGTEDWFDNGFLHVKEREAIKQAKITIQKQNKSMDANRIVTELRFGFWTSLFDVRYEHQQILWPRLLSKVFQYIPKSLRTRSYLSKQLNCIRNLRNRIFHYEPIWYRYDLLQQHQNMFNLLKWLSPTAHGYIVPLDHFKELYGQGFRVNRDLFTKTNHSNLTHQNTDRVDSNKVIPVLM